MRIEQQVLEALARVQASEPHLVAWLETRLNHQMSNMVKQSDEIAVRWAQGRSQELQELLDNLQGAANILRKAG